MLSLCMTDITLSFTPNELVSTGSTLMISGVPDVDAQTAQGAVHVFGIDGPVPVLVETDPAAGTVAVPTEKLEPGAYVLSVDGLLDTKGAALGSTAAPFTVTSFAGKVDERLARRARRASCHRRPRHATPRPARPHPARRRLPRGRQGRRARRRRTGRPRLRRRRVARWTPLEVLAAVDSRRYEKYGNLHETLFRHIEQLGSREWVDVVVWPVIDASMFDYEKPSKGEVDSVPDAQRKADAELRERVAVMSDALAKAKAKITIEAADDVPCIHATVTVAALRDLGPRRLDRRPAARRPQRGARPRHVGVGRPHRPCPHARLRRHRRAGRRVRVGPEQHGEPHVRRPLHQQPVGERPRPADQRRHPQHPGQRVARPRTRLPALLRQQQQTTTRCAGRRTRAAP